MVWLRVMSEGVKGSTMGRLALQGVDQGIEVVNTESDTIRVWDGDREEFVDRAFVAGEDEPLGRLVLYSVGDDVARGCVVVLPGGGYHHRADHEGSRQQLLGTSPSGQQIAQYSAEQRVDAHTPPTFIWSSADDASVPVQNSLLFAQALAAEGIEHELHVFEHGRHGLGLAEQHPYCGTWTMLAEHWLSRHGYEQPVDSLEVTAGKISTPLFPVTTTNEAIRLYIAGDSTAAAKSGIEKPMSGWGEYLSDHFQKQVQVENCAINGRSTRSFITDGRLDYIAHQLQAGDYLLIQFGHNDGKIDDPTRYTDPDTDYPAFLRRYIDTARNQGAIPVLLTSVSRRLFLENGQPDPLALERYPEMMRRVADDTNTPLLDLFTASQQLYRQLGEEGSKALFLHLSPEQHPNYPQGVEDNTHFSVYGAQHIAALVIAAITAHPQLKQLAQWVQ